MPVQQRAMERRMLLIPNSLCDAGSHSTTPPERKKKRVCEDKAVKVMKDVVEQLITAQQESDERFM